MISRYDKVKKRYASHRATALGRGIPFKLTWQEWDNWWLAHGVDKATSSSTRNASTLCMCRYNDSGAYELGNIYCDTIGNNIKTSFVVRHASNTYRNGREQAINTPYGSFKSIKEASDSLKLTRDQISYRLKAKPKEYYYAV